MADHWRYFERYAYGPPLFPHFRPDVDTGIIVAIPSFREPNLSLAIESLAKNEYPGSKVLVLVVINEPENTDQATTEINHNSALSLDQVSLPGFMELVVYKTQLPKKKAGVGLARKIGMDEAARWFNAIGKDGLITCYDSDCTCDPGYLKAIYQAFSERMLEAGIVYYEHPLSNKEIIQYELFLRYHIDALRFAGFPYAYQTLGSCISVRANTYQKHGGMNTRKAGEDFYFLHKIIPHCRFGEINDATIYPSARESDRVPFGTGVAITKISKTEEYLVYAPASFVMLKSLFDQVEKLYSHEPVNLGEPISEFLKINDFENALMEIHKNVSSLSSFRKRFYTWWDAFRALKYVHFVRDHYYPLVPLPEALQWLDTHYWQLNLKGTLEDQLIAVRRSDKSYEVKP